MNYEVKMVRQMIADGVIPQEVVEKYFPELKESDDERIRKGIIAYLKNLRGKHELLPDEWIAWLEKQGEQKPAWSEEDEKMLNSIIEDFGDGKTSNMLQEYFLKSLKSRVQPQPKQEWSKDDEDNFKHLMDEIVCLGNSRNNANRLYYDRLIKFLHELKNRVQPREEWRDKDERMLDRLIAYFEKRVAFTDDDNPRYANWLKSLRPQNRWKPSEEQMIELRRVISGCSYDIEPLTEMEEQLNKLREE